MKDPYTMKELAQAALRTNCSICFKDGFYHISHRLSMAVDNTLRTRVGAHARMHQLAAEWCEKNPPAPPPNLKVVVMTEDNRVIDEFLQVRLKHGSLEEMQRYNVTLVKWIMRAAGSAESMQVDGSIQQMPHVKTPKKVWELRRDLYQATHKPWCVADCPTLWAKIEQLLLIAEGRT